MDSIDKNNDKYVLVKAKGGMGNRMLCTVTGLLYGQLTGRKVIVDWRDMAYSNDGTNSFNEFFSGDPVHPETTLPENGTVWPEIWKGHLQRSMSEMLHQFDPDKHANPPSDVYPDNDANPHLRARRRPLHRRDRGHSRDSGPGQQRASHRQQAHLRAGARAR